MTAPTPSAGVAAQGTPDENDTMSEARCSTCKDYGYVITREAAVWGDDMQPEEAEPCFDCAVAVDKGWVSAADQSVSS